jgi:aspartyl-tRNA(Asn)/glutamyl-tRNA(Gln) amidotransferase subunit B
MLENPAANAAQVAEQEGWILAEAGDELAALIQEIAAKFPAKVQEYQSGKLGLLGFFVGQVMQASAGKYDPKVINQKVSQFLAAE